MYLTTDLQSSDKAPKRSLTVLPFHHVEVICFVNSQSYPYMIYGKEDVQNIMECTI